MNTNTLFVRLLFVLTLLVLAPSAFAGPTTMIVSRDKTGGTIGPLNTVGDDLCPADPTNGCDFVDTDDNVRTNDGVQYKFAVTADGPEDVVLNTELKLGMVWEDLPPACNPLTSTLTGDGITTPSLLMCDLGNKEGYAEDILLVAQVLGSNLDGATSGLASAEFLSNVSPDVILDATTIPDVDITAAPRANIHKDLIRQDVGVGTDGVTNGLIATYAYYLDTWDHDTNGNGADDPDPSLGNEMLKAVLLPNGEMGFQFTEDLDFSGGFANAPGAYILSCTLDTGTSNRLPNRLLSSAIAGQENRSVIDVGSNACSSTGPGARTVQVYHWDADLSFSHTPTQTRGGAAIPGDRKIAAFGSIRVFIPLSDFDNPALDPAGEIPTVNTVYGFEPTSISDQINFLGDDQNAGDDGIDATAEDKDDNVEAATFIEAKGSFSHLYRCAVPGEPVAPQCVNWTSPPTTATGNWAGNGAIEPTQDLGFASSTSYNNRTFLPVENLKLCEVLDTSLYQVVDITPGVATIISGAGKGVAGVDYIIEYGVGYVTAWPPNPAVASSNEVGLECSAPAANWFPTTTAALAAGLGPITKVRMIRLTDLPIGKAINMNTQLAALPDTDDPAGTLLVTQGTYMEDRAQPDWRECGHLAGSHNIPVVAQTANGCGDRVYLTRALARMSKETVPNDDINSMSAGGSVIFKLFPSFTSVAGNNVESVQVVDTMPPEFEYVPNSATQAGVPFEPVVTGDITIGQTLTWDLGLIPANAFIEPITFSVSTPITTTNGTLLPNIARTDAPSDSSTEQQRGDERNVTVVSPISMVMAKQVSDVLVDQDIAFEYTVQYLNTTPNDFNLVDIIDVIPFNGDNRNPAPSAFLGTTAISNANAVSTNHLFYYTKDLPTGIVTNATDPLNDLATGGTNWCLATAGNVDPAASPTNGSAAANCPATATEVTAIRIVDTQPMPQSTLRNFKFTLTPSNNVGGDQYSNRAQGFADAITLQPSTALVTTVVREADRMIELQKSVAEVDGNQVTFNFYAENTGDTPLNSLTLIDDLDAVFGAGNYSVVAPGPTVTAAPATGTFVLNPNFSGAAGATGGVANNDIFDPTAASMLPVGEGGTVTVTISIDNVVDNQGLGLGNFENTATIGGTTPQGATVEDVSDDPNGAGPEDNNPAPFGLTPAIGTAKQATSLVPVGMGNYEVTYTMVIENTGFVPLHDVQLVDDLTGPFGTLQATAADVDAAGEYFVTAGPTITTNSVDALSADAAFTGTAPNTGLLDVSAGGSLDFGETATLTIKVTFRPDPANSPYDNQTTASGDTVDDDDVDGTDGVTDLSDDGVDPDPDGDGNATEEDGVDGGDSDENDPTPLEISAIGVAKDVKSLTPNADGSFTVVYSVVTENFGNTILHDVQLTDDLTAPFGTNVATAADVNVAGEYFVDTSLITIITNAADPFTVNNGFNGDADQGLLDIAAIPNDGSLAVGESFTMEFSVLFYPDFTNDPYNNQITASGDLLDDNDVDPSDGIADLSDDGADPDPDGDGYPNEDSAAGGDSDENDPTPLALPSIRNAKSVTSIVRNATTPAHFDVTFEIVVENTGNVDLENLTLVDAVDVQLAPTYKSVITAPAIVAATTTATTDPGLGAFPANIFNGTTGVLKPGELITVVFTLELDLLAAGAPDPLTNQSTAGGTTPATDPDIPGVTVTDLSDDGADPSSDNSDAPGDNGAGGTDDPTPISIDSISLVKTQTSFAPSTTTPGNYDVTYDMVVQNTGSTTLDNLVLRDRLDAATNLGSAFIGVTTLPSIVATGTTATTNPGLDGGYTGFVANQDIFNGTSGILEPGQTIAITMVVEVDPDAAGAPSPLQNQARVAGNPPGGDPADLKDNVSDLSDSGDDPLGDNPGEPGDTGGSDDPVPLIIADIGVAKPVTAIVANSANPLYNDVTFQLIVKNTGTVDLDNLTLFDDVATRFGSALKAIATQPVFVAAATTATTSPTLGNLPNVFAGNDGLLKPTEIITVEFTLTLDFADPLAPIPLTNQATAGGNPPGGTPGDPSDDVTDLSDAGSDPSTNNPGSPGDSGGSDDPTPLDFNSISLSKTQSSFAPNATTPDNFDVTYTMIVQNTGTTILDNLTLIDQLDTPANLGSAFVRVSPTILPAIVAGGTTATTTPGLNGSFDGRITNPGIFNGTSGTLEPGQTIEITMVVEVDPDAVGAPSPLQNQATVGGNPPNGVTGDPSDDVTDLSDSGSDPLGSNPGEPGDTGGSDDPVPLSIAGIAVTKEQFSVAMNVSNPTWTDIGMRLVVENTGNVDLDNLTLVDDVAAQLGSTYKGVAPGGDPVISASTATTDPTLGTFPINVFAGNDGLLKPGETITIEFVLTLDLADPGAPVPLTNQVTVSGNPPGGDPNDPTDDVTDLSDSGSDPGTNNSGEPGDTGGSDDPTPINANLISLSKAQASFAPNTTRPENFDVVYTMVVQNTGTTILDNLTLTDQLDAATNLGTAFFGLPVTPAVTITGGTATTMPTLNSGFDGTTSDPELFDGASGVLEPGQIIELTMTVEVDPDTAGAPSPMLNQATVGGNPPGGDPSDPSDNVTDNSDSGDDPTGTNPGEPGDSGGADDPTPLQISAISLAKAVTATAVNALDPTNFDITFELVVENTGTVDLDNLTLVDDVATQLGSTYVGVTTAPIITASTATTDPSIGTFPVDVFAGNDGLLEPGQVITLEFVLEMDLSAAGAPVPLTNQATAGGNPEGGDPNDPGDDVTDLSDDGADPAGPNAGSPGDTGGTDDPTPIEVNSISLTKDQTGFAPNATRLDNFDVTYNLVVQNTGTTILDNLTLIDQLDAATNLGTTYFGVTTAPSITGGTATTMPGLNAGFDGTATNPGIFDGVSGSLEPGQTIIVNMVVEVDPDAAGAPSPLLNQASTGGNPPGGDPSDPADDVTDLSDSGADPTSTNPGEPGDTGGTDDPTPLGIASIGLAKVQTTAVRSTTNPIHWDVGFQLNVINNGTTDLENLTLVDDVAAELGATYVAVTTAPAITASTATTDPTLGSFPVDVFSGTDGLLKPGETITVDFVLEMNLTSAPIPLTNQAEVGANPVGGDPDDPNDDVSDLSDDGTDPVGDNPDAPGDDGTGGTDDPTPILVDSLGLAKEQTSFVPNGANFNVTYQLIMKNNGTTVLTNLTLADDLAAQMGPVYIGVINAPTIVASTATTDPGIGSFIPDVFDGSSGVLEPGQEITVEFTVELDPAATGAVYPITNQAQAGGNSPTGSPMSTSDDTTDPSDAGNDPDSTNPDDPGDTGGQDDPTPLDIPSAVFGTVWLNQDGDNTLDGADTRLEGWLIEVKDANGNVVGTTTTDADGNYRIEDLPSGNYEICITNPEGVTMKNEPVFLPPGLDEEVNQPIDPSGVIYDSSNGEPIEGVTIIITDINGVPLPDVCVQPGQQTQTTGEDGVYRFDLNPDADPACPSGATEYLLEIIATPDEYLDTSNQLFPETGTMDDTPLGTDCPADTIVGPPCNIYDMPIPDSDPINNPAPFYLSFTLETGDQDVIWNHIPLDIAATPASILLAKDVNKSEALIGDLVQYTLRAESQESFPLVNISLVDNLPGGFKYVAGSANLIRAGADGVFDTGDDVVAPINATGVDPVSFGTINFDPNESVLVRYFARISTGVTQGDYVNTAVAEAPGGITASNIATATVAIIEDPLLDKTTIIGKVFHDRDRDGYQDNADATGVKIGSEYFGWNSHQVGDISGRVRPTDPIEEHRAVVRMPYTEGGDNSFRVSTNEGTVINVDNAGEITYDHTGKMAHGMTGQDLRLDLARDANDLVITITNHGIQEEGIPGVRLATVEGLLIETDQYGRYHIADVSTGHFTTGTNYIVKVDDATLPEGTVFTTENPRVQRLTQSLMTRFNFGVALPEVEEVAACEPSFNTVEDVSESVVSKTLDNVLEPIYFASGRSQIPAGYADTVRTAMSDHADKQNLRLEFIGHTDNERLSAATTAKYGSNQGLSEARAKMVADQMAATLNLSGSQMMTSGRGDTQPAASNDTADGMALNRRVDVVLVYDEVNRKVSTRQVAMDNCTTMVSENVTDVMTKTATGVIDPILFVSGKSDIPEDYAAQLRDVIDQYKDKDNVRIRFTGHTDNERLAPSTAAKYGDNQGLSEARARQVADALAGQLGLDMNAVEAVGYGEGAPVASNATRDGMAQNRRVEIEVLYDEAVSKVRQVQRMQRNEPSRVSLPHGGMIWATEDPGKIDPRLDISASNAIVLKEGEQIAPVSFRIYTNYQAYIDRYEINVYADHDRDLIRPVATIAGDALTHTEQVEWMPEFADSLTAGKHMVYQLRVWDAAGRMDRTAPQLLKVINENLFDQSTLSEAAAKADRELLETFGNSTLLQRTIPIYGSRVRIHGADVSSEYALTINGEPVYIDANNRFVYEQQLPLGEHSFEVVVTGDNEQQWVRDVSVVVDGDYMFLVGMANLTLGENDLSGSSAPLNGDHRFDDSGFVDGRIAFYMKGKVKGKYLITAQMDTTEDDLDNLGDNIKRKDPKSVFRRLDPDQFYPVYGDDSTTISDVDTQGAFYLRADWDNNKALWGNFNTEFTGTEFSQYNRSLYGAQIVHKSLDVTEHGDHKTEVYGFISEAQTAQAHNEFIATGGSLYYLRETDIVRGSDKVWVEVRARDSERVVETVVLEEGRDYQIDYLQGRIILNRPLTQVSNSGALSIIRSQPLEGDDVVLLVDYEYVPTGFSGDDLTAGVRGKGWLGDDLSIGVTYVTEDRDNSADYELMGLDATYRIGKGSWIKAEYSETESSVSDGWLSANGGLSFNQLNQSSVVNNGGSAMGIEARINLAELTDESLQGYINAWYKDREAGFSSTRENDGVDTTDTGVELQWEGDVFSLLARANQLEQGNNTRTILNLQGKYELNDTVNLIAEIRNEDSETADADLGFTSGGQATLFALGGEYQLSEHTKLYGSAQTVIEDDASYESNDALTFGIESQLSEKLAMLVELSSGDRGDALTLGVDYNLRDNLNLQIEAGFGDAATSQIGSTFTTASGLELYGSYAVDSDRTDNERRTLTIGQRKNFGDSLRIFSEQQFTNDKQESGIGHIFGIDHRFTDEMSASVSIQHSDLSGINGDISRDVGTVGLSYVDNKKKASTKLEYRKDDGAENVTQWLTTNALDWTHDEHLRYMLRLNMAVTKNDDTNVKDGKFIEADIGLAYRPAFSDRLNVLAKYTYLFDLPAQLSTGSLIGQNDSSTDERAHVLSAEALYDLRRKWEIGGKIAWRKGETRSARDSGPWFDSGARFAALRLRYHFIDNWDGLIEYRILQAETGDDQRDGAMLVLHRHIGEHFKVGIGFNFTDFTDDLTTQDYDASGFFLDITGKW